MSSEGKMHNKIYFDHNKLSQLVLYKYKSSWYVTLHALSNLGLYGSQQILNIILLPHYLP